MRVRHWNSRSGKSLVEMLVVIAIILILLSIILPLGIAIRNAVMHLKR